MHAIDFIPLPRLTALGALALAEQLLSSAEPHKKDFPKLAAGARTALVEAKLALAAALRDRRGTPVNAADLPALDQAIDGAYAALSSYVDAFSRLPGGGPMTDAAWVVDSAVFPDGLKFTQLPYTLEWSESQVRIERMDTPEVAQALETLKAQTFVDAIRKAHAAYGKALGMGAAKSAAAPSAVRPAYLALLTAMRWYVVKVLASVEPSQPDTQALADALLVPLTSWDVAAGKRSGAQEPEQAAAGGSDGSGAPAAASAAAGANPAAAITPNGGAAPPAPAGNKS
jgi:hypothetical protein